MGQFENALSEVLRPFWSEPDRTNGWLATARYTLKQTVHARTLYRLLLVLGINTFRRLDGFTAFA